MSTPHNVHAMRIRDLIEPVVMAVGFYVEDVKISQAGRRSLVRVMVDGDDGISLDDVAIVSNAISEVLDEESAAVPAGAYTLEVTSPGVDRPLTLPRHWRRNSGRLVKVRVGDAEITGRIVEADDDKVGIDVNGEVRQFEVCELGPGSVQIEFDRKEG